MFGLKIISEKEFPFVREIQRLIKDRPEYLDGIRAGVVHLAYNPGCKPNPEGQEKCEVTE